MIVKLENATILKESKSGKAWKISFDEAGMTAIEDYFGKTIVFIREEGIYVEDYILIKATARARANRVQHIIDASDVAAV